MKRNSGNKTILVTGGAGYIGSHMLRLLLDKGYKPVVFDNLSTGHRQLVPRQVPFCKGDLRDPRAMDRVFKEYKPFAVIHFAGLIAVGESVQKPKEYYDNNVAGSLELIAAAVRHDVRAFIFSSTAAVYAPSKKKISEKDRIDPKNPYGLTKLLIEQALSKAHQRDGLKYMALRYFNACGASADGATGEWHEPETHLIPNIIRASLTDKPVMVFGDDYATEDGTCIRDYIHVDDLCDAHLAAIKALLKGQKAEAINLGTGHGSSVMEVIRKVEKAARRPVKFQILPRRAGDVERLVCDPSRARRILGWKARRSLEDAVRSAMAWEIKKIS